MKICFDTSTLVAALLQQHPHHPIAFPHLEAAHEGKIAGYLTTHGVAELFATLTALPLKPRLTPSQVHQMIQSSVTKKFQIIPLGAKEYEEALNLVVLGNHSSGAIYDALHIVGARSTECDKLYTLNRRHFHALAPGDPLIASPV